MRAGADAAHGAYGWTSLGKGGVEAEASARREAMELARALAAQTIVAERDAVAEELAERTRAVADTLWSASPLSGYGLHSSLGAYLIAKVAVGWAPSGMIGLRHEPLSRGGLLEDLVEHGVDRAVALAIASDWDGVEPGFMPDVHGLDTSRIAGLAEGSLTRRERNRALSQIAYSARCLDRLASTAAVLSSMRLVLPTLAPESLGRGFVIGSAALALGRPDRVLELIGERPNTLPERTLAELAASMLALGRGETPELDDAGAILTPRLASEAAAEAAARARGDDDGDDVLEIVEERVDHSALAAARKNGGVHPARWPLPEGGFDPLDAGTLAEWQHRYRSTLGADRSAILGLRFPPPAPTAVGAAVPPDERLVAVQLAQASSSAEGKEVGDVTERIPVGLLMSLEALKTSGTVFDALFPPVRGALRAIAHAAEGRAPSDDSIAAAGDLAWVLHRAKALALIVTGELESAVNAAAALPLSAAPEGRWAQDRLRRFGGRREVHAGPEEARPAAASLAMDLAHQLGRTIAGTLSSSGVAERTA